jgi:UDP-N-acetylglucosamine 4,6-dehydratase/5-epimerase
VVPGAAEGRRAAMNWSQQSILITGGTGSFGRKFVELVLRDLKPRKLIVFSRDELKQHEMRQQVPDTGDSPVRYFLGDVRDRERLYRAFYGVDVVVHAAALKQVPACEYNPFEAILTNVMGAKNVVDAAIDCGVTRVMALSTDKACQPVNLYGATKLCAEKLFVDGNAYSGDRPVRFACARYGNVVASRGSVIPVFLEQRRNGRITITDPAMSRFWITLEQGVRFVVRSIEEMHGGEIFVPKIPSMTLLELSRTIAPDCEVDVIGMRPGEKTHEILVSEDEARNTVELDDKFVILPAGSEQTAKRWKAGRPLSAGFRYASDSNTQQLTRKTLTELLGPLA